MKKRRGLVYWLITLMVLFGIAVVLLNPSLRVGVTHLLQLRTIGDIREYVHSLGVWGPVALILLMVLHSVTFVPSEIIMITDVVLFGPIWGIVYAWVGSMLGAYLSFFLARKFGRPIVDRFVPRRMLTRFDQFFEREGLKGIFVLRLIPLISFNALNYASGLTRMTIWEFTWTTGLGILPAGILFALLYQSAAGQKFGFIGLTVVGVAILAGMVLKAKMQKKYDLTKKQEE